MNSDVTYQLDLNSDLFVNAVIKNHSYYNIQEDFSSEVFGSFISSII